MGIAGSKIDSKDYPAKWMHTAKLLPKYQNDKFNRLSQGMKSVNGNTVVRLREDSDKVDGARWCRGFTTGKHVFEIAFPRRMRGKHASIGVGTKTAAISVKNPSLPVGFGQDSWGVDLVSRKAMHGGKIIQKYPNGFRQIIADRFYMYIDLDSRYLYFGTDDNFYGTAVMDVGSDEEPLYPMVTCSVYGATVTMVYRGKGKEVEGPLRKKR